MLKSGRIGGLPSSHRGKPERGILRPSRAAQLTSNPHPANLHVVLRNYAGHTRPVLPDHLARL